MPEVNIDRMTDLTMKEERGAVVAYNRLVRVIFVPAEIAALRNPNAGSVLSAALAAVSAAGLTPMSKLVASSLDATSQFAPMVLVRRTPSIAENEPCCVDVRLEYEHIVSGPNQYLRNPFSSTPRVVFGRGKTSMREKTTNFFYPFGLRDTPEDEAKKTQITVAHQFPLTDTIPPTTYYSGYPRIVVQGGEVKMPFPESVLTIEGMISTDKPIVVAEKIVTCVNKGTWLGKAEGMWICSEAAWTISETNYDNASRPTYKFTFEFQQNYDGWDPEVAFKDKRTGNPPASVVKASIADDNGVVRLQDLSVLVPTPGGNVTTENIPAGYWRVPALRRVDFNEFFGGDVIGADDILVN